MIQGSLSRRRLFTKEQHTLLPVSAPALRDEYAITSQIPSGSLGYVCTILNHWPVSIIDRPTVIALGFIEKFTRQVFISCTKGGYPWTLGQRKHVTPHDILRNLVCPLKAQSEAEAIWVPRFFRRHSLWLRLQTGNPRAPAFRSTKRYTRSEAPSDPHLHAGARIIRGGDSSVNDR
jgi:hypothetical protein